MPFHGEIMTKDVTLERRIRRIEYLNFAFLHIKKDHWQYPHLSLLGMILKYSHVIIDVSYFLNQCVELRRSVEYLLR